MTPPEPQVAPTRADLSAALAQSLAREGLLILIYGGSGVGKTVDAVAAFPRARLISQAGSFLPRLTFLGLTPDRSYTHTVRSLVDVRDLLLEIKERYAAARERNPNARVRPVVIDEGTLLALTMEADEEASGRHGKNKYGKYAAVGKVIAEIRDIVRHLRAIVILTAHELIVGDDEDAMTYPKLGTRNTSADLSPLFDLTLHAVRTDTRPYEHPGAYEINADLSATSKDRLTTFRGLGPLNLRAILGINGVACPRASGLEWQDGLAEDVRCAAAALPTGTDGLPDWDARADLWIRALDRETAAGRLEHHVTWAMRDGLDAHELSVLSRSQWRTAARRRPAKTEEAV